MVLLNDTDMTKDACDTILPIDACSKSILLNLHIRSSSGSSDAAPSCSTTAIFRTAGTATRANAKRYGNIQSKDRTQSCYGRQNEDVANAILLNIAKDVLHVRQV